MGQQAATTFFPNIAAIANKGLLFDCGQYKPDTHAKACIVYHEPYT